jgi:LEA14-like dessication related protein
MKKYSLFLITLSILISSCVSYKDIEVKDVTNIKINKVSTGGAEIQAALAVNNPNKFNIKIKKIEADIILNNQNLGKINLIKKVTLKKNTDGIYDFTINTKFSDLAALAPTLLLGGGLNLKVKGEIKGKVGLLAKKYPVEVEKKISSNDLNLF